MTVTPTPLRGIWPALLTPMNADLGIDEPLFAAHARNLIAAGCAGVTPFGTTGEGPSFTVAERRQAVEALIAGGVPAEKILVSTSCAALPDTLALTRHALDVGAWGCLMMPPFFFKGVTDEGIVDAYRHVIDVVADSRLRLLLYHIPQVSGVGLTLAAIATLRELYPQAIVGIKDSGCELAHSLALADAFMPTPQSSFRVHVGNEPDLPELARRGSTGAVSGLANFVPRMVQRLVARPDSDAALHDLVRVKALLALLGGYALLPALKCIMAQLSGDAGWSRVRAPLLALPGGQQQKLEREIIAFGIDPRTD